MNWAELAGRIVGTVVAAVAAGAALGWWIKRDIVRIVAAAVGARRTLPGEKCPACGWKVPHELGAPAEAGGPQGAVDAGGGAGAAGGGLGDGVL